MSQQINCVDEAKYNKKKLNEMKSFDRLDFFRVSICTCVKGSWNSIIFLSKYRKALLCSINFCFQGGFYGI